MGLVLPGSADASSDSERLRVTPRPWAILGTSILAYNEGYGYAHSRGGTEACSPDSVDIV
jgi:hypothetical protein